MLIALACPSAPLRGQTGGELAQRCATATGVAARCAEAATAARALAADYALVSGFGSEVSGTATTLGTRLGEGPRVTFGMRAGGVRSGVPDVAAAMIGSDPLSFTATAIHFDVGAGIFDGFRIMPTVGGFLSVDLVGRVALVYLPGELGMTPSSTTYSFGARIGLLRESFTLPGVSISASHRILGRVGIGLETGPGNRAVIVDPSVTSIRATVGKDLFAFELFGGVGRDSFGGDADLTIPDGPFGTTGHSDRIEESRLLYFFGASRSFNVVFRLSAELGWARGFDPVAGSSGAFDAGRSSFFADFALRLTI